jgi:hypothetical protein
LESDDEHAGPPENAHGRDASGRWYHDHYKVVVDCDRQTYKLWDQLLMQLKIEFNSWHELLRWGQIDERSGGGYRGYPSTSGHGNILEAMNCAVSVYDKHYMDRDLNKTGQNIILLNAGSGLFWVLIPSLMWVQLHRRYWLYAV